MSKSTRYPTIEFFEGYILYSRLLMLRYTSLGGPSMHLSAMFAPLNALPTMTLCLESSVVYALRLANSTPS